MTPADLLARYPPPCPPGVDEATWARLVDATGERSRTAPAVTREEWRALLDAEHARRGRYVWRLDHEADEKLWPMVERTKRREKDRDLCLRDDWHWIDHYAVVEDPQAPRRKVIPWVTWPIHRSVILWWDDELDTALEAGEERHVMLLKSRSVGLSWSAVVWLVRRWLQRRRFSALVGSITLTELDNLTPRSLVGKVRWLIDEQPKHLRPDYPGLPNPREIRMPQKLIEHPGGARIEGGVMSQTFAVSGRCDVVIRDEAAKVRPSLQHAAKMGQTSVAALGIDISTPHGKGDTFHADWTQLPDARKLELHWPVDPRRDDEWFARLLLENGGRLTKDERAREYGCSFAGVSGYRIWHIDASVVGYDDNTPGWAEVAEAARSRWLTIGGMDFGSGLSPSVFLALLVDWSDAIPHPEYGKVPTVWVDLERLYHRVPSHEIGADIMGWLGPGCVYGGQLAIYGDPSGTTPQANQESWESDLRRAGVPLTCLPADPFAQHHFILKSIDLVDWMFEQGRIRIHRGRAPQTLIAVEQWQWDVPEGVKPEQLSRETIKWRKDGWSHPCEALWYAVLAMLRHHQPRGASATAPLVPLAGTSAAAEMGNIWPGQGGRDPW